MSTEALHSEFFDITAVAGIDTSPMMLNVAKERTTDLINKPYYFVNKAHNLSLADNSVDITTCMFTFHETPLHGIIKIMREMNRITTSEGVIAIVDIAPEYKPSFWMELGEPYIQPYLSNIDKIIYKFVMNTNKNLDRIVLVQHHVVLWVLFDDVNL
jgi:ubiquinone/menaquinone biosynthesis C-methylase UbiE